MLAATAAYKNSQLLFQRSKPALQCSQNAGSDSRGMPIHSHHRPKGLKPDGRTATVKIKYADFQIATRSRSVTSVIASRAELHVLSLDLIRSVYPLRKGIR